MYHAEVKLIKTVRPVDEVGRAPWPKLQVRCSFELRYVESRCEKAPSREERRANSRKILHAQLKDAGICTICKVVASRPSKSSCASCFTHRQANEKAWRLAKNAKAARFT